MDMLRRAPARPYSKTRPDRSSADNSLIHLHLEANAVDIHNAHVLIVP